MLFFITAILSGGFISSAEAKTQNLRWAERNVAVFRNIMFDFKTKQMTSDSVNSDLQDCSTASTFCFKTPIFEMSLPQSCGFVNTIGKGPDRDGLVVIAKADQPLQHLQLTPTSVFLVYHAKFPFIVYEYLPEVGIVGVSYDEFAMMGGAPRADILKSIAVGDYAKDKQKRWSYSPRLTTDSFGACKAR